MSGYAVAYYGYPRSTGDMDIWIGVSQENAERVVHALIDFGFSNKSLVPADFLTPNTFFRMGVPPLRIEILMSVSGLDFQEAYPFRISADIDGVDVSVIDLEHLKKNKRATGRNKDLNDLENLS